MFRYKIQLLDESLPPSHQKELELDIDNPWQDLINKEWNGYHDDIAAIVDENGLETSPARPKNYKIIKENMSAELAAKEQRKQKLESAKNDLKAVRTLITDAKEATTDAKQRQVLIKLAKAVLQLSKAQGLADVDELED